MKFIKLFCFTCFLFASITRPSWAHESSAKSSITNDIADEKSIKETMKAIFDKPGNPLNIHPVSIEGVYAVVGWIQGNHGGRAFLKKQNGKWSIQVCGGDDLRNASTLAMIGMDPDLAKNLAIKVLSAEKKLPANQIKKLSMFDGMMKIDGNDNHEHSEKNSHAASSK